MMRGKEGVTLIEVMIVVVIVGILAAIAIPAYNDYITRSRRSDAFTALETVRAAQEMYRAERGGYRNTADFNANLLPGCSQGMAGSNYTISVARPTTTTFTATATPTAGGKQAGDFTFTVDQNGAKTYNGTAVNSWEDLPRH
jgi:type IV pilus assembly protein PilE